MNVVTLSTSEMIQFNEHVRIRLFSQLITGFSRVLQKLQNYFNGTGIFFVFVVLAALVLLNILSLNLMIQILL